MCQTHPTFQICTISLYLKIRLHTQLPANTSLIWCFNPHVYAKVGEPSKILESEQYYCNALLISSIRLSPMKGPRYEGS